MPYPVEQDDEVPARPSAPEGACLLWGRNCQNLAAPGSALCAACDATMNPPCLGCGAKLRSDSGIERGYCARCFWHLSNARRREVMSAVRGRAVSPEDREEVTA